MAGVYVKVGEEQILLSDRIGNVLELLQSAEQEQSTIQFKKLLLQAARLLHEEDKAIEEEGAMIRENAVPAPQGAAQWTEANSRRAFIAEDVKRTQTTDDLIRRFDYAFKTGDTIGCYLIWRIRNQELRVGNSELEQHIRNIYPSYKRAVKIIVAKTDIQSQLADQLISFAQEMLSIDDVLEIQGALYGDT
jgi:hypothetical protein